MNPPERQWCDPDCPHASFPTDEHLGGACHTFIAIYCSKYDKLVQKSGLCLDITEGKLDEEGE
jgi:hypothetical protein